MVNEVGVTGIAAKLVARDPRSYWAGVAGSRRKAGRTVGCTRPGRAMAGLLVAVMGALALAGCSPYRPPGGDPGNVRLHELANDPVFSKLPPKSYLLRPIKEVPSTYDSGFFGAGGHWTSPAVVVLFHSDLSVKQVATFYDHRTLATGWQQGINDNSIGRPVSWEKTFPANHNAFLTLSYADKMFPEPPLIPGAFELTGAI
ncbi:MAG: hypothetical protein ACRDWV_03675 [Acidimicrobiales bacterium]